MEKRYGTISLTLTQRPRPQLIYRKRRYKYISRLTSSNDAPQTLTHQKSGIFRFFKTIYAYSQLSCEKKMLFPSLRQAYKTTRYCIMNSSPTVNNPRTFKSFIMANKNLETLKLGLSIQTIKLLGKNPKLKRICLGLSSNIGCSLSTKKLLQARNRLNRQRRLQCIDLEGTSSELEGVKYLYKGAHENQDIGVNLSKITKNTTRLNFMGTKTSKISLTNILFEPAKDVLKNLSKFTRLQVLSIRRIENNLPQNYTFGDFNVLKDLSLLRELNLVLYLGSIDLTENFLKGVKLPESLEHLYIWLTGACFAASKVLMKAAQQFGKSLQNCAGNLRLLVLLFDVLFGVDGFKHLVNSIPEDLEKIETFHIYSCCTEDQGNSLIELADVMKKINTMRNLELLIVNIEQLGLAGELPDFEEVRNLRYMYLQSEEDSEDFDLERSLEIMKFVSRSVGLRHLRIDFWVKWLDKEGMRIVKKMLLGLKNLELLGLKLKVLEECVDEILELGYIMKKSKYLRDRFVDVVIGGDCGGELKKRERFERAFESPGKYFNDWIRVVSNEDKKEIYKSND